MFLEDVSCSFFSKTWAKSNTGCTVYPEILAGIKFGGLDQNDAIRENFLTKNSFQAGVDLKNGQKQGSDENTQDDYLTSERWRKKNSRFTVG